MTTTRRLLNLPIEIRHLISKHLTPPRFTPLARSHSTSSSSSSSTSILFPPRPSYPSTPLTHEPGQVVSEIFESPDETLEYSSVPRSTLDFPTTTTRTPRTPDESLLSLLRTKDYSLALNLLNELDSQQQGGGGRGRGIQTRYLFGLYAYKVLARSIHHQRGGGGGGGGVIDRDWLKWWELTPSLVGRVHRDVENLKAADKSHSIRARKIINKLNTILDQNDNAVIEEEQEEEEEEVIERRRTRSRTAAVVEMMIEFGEILAKQGQARIVAQELIPRIAQEGRVDEAFKLWEVTLGELRAQFDRFEVRGEYLNKVSKEVEARELLELGPEERQENQRRRVEERTREMERWWTSRSVEAYKVLVRSRERIIKALANLGRVEESVATLVDTSKYPTLFGSAKMKISKPVYLALLAQLGTQDRFDLFERVFRQLDSEGRKLVRIRREELRSWSPYFVRGSDYPTLQEGIPSAQEAFTTFRDRHAVSLIEEGSFEPVEEVLEKEEEEKENEGGIDTTEYARAIGQDSYHYGRSTSRAQSRRLVKLVESERLDLALDKLTDLLSKGPLPSAHSVATLIHSVSTHPNGSEALKAIDELVNKSYWRRGFWATCRMLADLEAGELKLVVRRFRDHFTLKGLPRSLVSAIQGATIRTVSTRRYEQPSILLRRGGGGGIKHAQRYETTTCNAYTLSILMQALVPLLSNSHRTSGGSQHLRRISSSLFQPRAYQIVPSHKRASLGSSNQSTSTNQSPLDPYTFIPFLLLTLQQQTSSSSSSSASSSSTEPNRRCQELLEILSSMQTLGIVPQPPHLALLVSAYARWSNPIPVPSSSPSRRGLKEFRYLLNAIENNSSDLNKEEEDSIDPTLVEFVKRQFPSSLRQEQGPGRGGGGGQELQPRVLSPKLYATILKSLRLRGGGGPSTEAGEKDELKVELKREAFEVLERLMQKIGVEGLREMLASPEGRGMRFEVGKLGSLTRGEIGER